MDIPSANKEKSCEMLEAELIKVLEKYDGILPTQYVFGTLLYTMVEAGFGIGYDRGTILTMTDDMCTEFSGEPLKQ